MQAFPANVNVAGTLSLAGIGYDATTVRVIADPGISRNVHQIEVRGGFGVLNVRVENLPSPENSMTSYLAVLSAIATLAKPDRAGVGRDVSNMVQCHFDI